MLHIYSFIYRFFKIFNLRVVILPSKYTKHLEQNHPNMFFNQLAIAAFQAEYGYVSLSKNSPIIDKVKNAFDFSYMRRK